MKKKVLSVALFTAMAALALGPISANAAGNGFYGVGKLGAVFPSDSDADTGFAGDIGIGYDFLSGSALLGVEATIGYYNSSAKSPIDGTDINTKTDIDIVPFALTVKAGGKIADKMRLYAGAGLDVVYTSMDFSSDRFTYNGSGPYRLGGSAMRPSLVGIYWLA